MPVVVRVRALPRAVLSLCAAVAVAPRLRQAPGEVPGVVFPGPDTLAWDAVSGGTLFAGRIPELMAAHGLDAASPPADIVDFWADILFGGALTPAEKQAVIDYLTTDDSGAPAPVDNARLRETVGFMMGLAQFLEQ